MGSKTQSRAGNLGEEVLRFEAPSNGKEPSTHPWAEAPPHLLGGLHSCHRVFAKPPSLGH